MQRALSESWTDLEERGRDARWETGSLPVGLCYLPHPETPLMKIPGDNGCLGAVVRCGTIWEGE